MMPFIYIAANLFLDHSVYLSAMTEVVCSEYILCQQERQAPCIMIHNINGFGAVEHRVRTGRDLSLHLRTENVFADVVIKVEASASPRQREGRKVGTAFRTEL